MIEVIIANQATHRLAAELTVFFFVNAFEQGALIPADTFVALEGLVQILLRDIHHANLQQFIGLGVIDQMMQSAPSAFQLLEFGMMQNQVDLLA